MKIVNLVCAILFVLFAYFQFNDPDSWAWIAMYGIVALLFGLKVSGRYWPWLTLGVAAFLGVGLLVYAPGLWQFLTNDDGIRFAQGMSNEYQYIEEAREFGGLLIALAAVSFLLIQGRSAK
jgi:hypothetical protein